MSTTNEHYNAQTEAKDVAVAFSESIKGRTTLITGVNKKGIGYATAEAFASRIPACLILTGRSQTKLDECRDALRTAQPSVKVDIDVTDLPSLKSHLEWTRPSKERPAESEMHQGSFVMPSKMLHIRRERICKECGQGLW